MKKVKMKVFIACIVAGLLVGLAVSPASAVTVIWKGANVDITLGLPATSLEFENPILAGKTVNGYTILEWLDADYTNPPPTYKDWVASHPGTIDGCATEIWLRGAGQQISTATTVASSIVSIHMTGDDNDGQAEVLVDGVLRAVLDMGTVGLSQTALIIVKGLSPTIHPIIVRDVGFGTVNRLGTDVHTFGAAALQFNWNVKWWPHFWFLDARIQLVQTRGYITVPTGFWWGWYPWYYGNYWYLPWQGYLGWYEPYSRYWYRPYWNFWPWYQLYRPWWNYWYWRGGPWFWGFSDRLTYRYTYWSPRIIYYWSWYWDPQGSGSVMELVTQGDENDPNGKRIKPFPSPSIPGFTAQSHEFSVNGGKATGSFSSLQFISTSNLQSHYASRLNVTADDVNAFMDSEIVKELMKNGPGYVGVQDANWTHPDSTIVSNANPMGIGLIKGSTSGAGECMYEVKLSKYPLPPNLPPWTVVIASSDPCHLMIGGTDANGVRELTFDGSNYEQPQPVYVSAIDDSINQGDLKVKIAHYLKSDPNEGFTQDVDIQDNNCGGLGFLVTDINQDCETNLLDFVPFANDWLVKMTPSHGY